MEQLTRIAAAQLDMPRQLAAKGLARAFDRPGLSHRQARDAAAAARSGAGPRPAPDTRLNAEIGRDRVFALARGRLDEIKAVGGPPAGP